MAAFPELCVKLSMKFKGQLAKLLLLILVVFSRGFRGIAPEMRRRSYVG